MGGVLHSMRRLTNEGRTVLIMDERLGEKYAKNEIHVEPKKRLTLRAKISIIDAT